MFSGQFCLGTSGGRHLLDGCMRRGERRSASCHAPVELWLYSQKNGIDDRRDMSGPVNAGAYTISKSEHALDIVR